MVIHTALRLRPYVVHNNHLTVTMLYIISILLLSPLCMIMLFFAFPISDEKPTLPQLLEMDMPSRVTDCFKFGTLLLCDKYGNKMSIISENCRGSPVRMTTEVLKEWLGGKGVEVSWDTLISTLKKCKLSVLAYEVQTALQQL